MTETRSRFPIVGVGASAGGLEALAALFRPMPADVGCAFVVVTHLNPDRKSLLPEIIARYTRMPVQAASDGAMVAVNEVYVLPADSVLSIQAGRLQVRKAASGRRERKPIDVFLGALADDQKEYAGGIILSGSNGDGTLGMQAIKERGGLTLAQVADGSPPQYPEMPESAIASGAVSFAIPVGEMALRLAEFAGSLRSPPGAAGHDELMDDEHTVDAARQDIYAILRNQIGHDFAGYKTKTFLRRVQRRMQACHVATLDAYIGRLRRDPQEVGALFRDLLINVTNFFRDESAFEALEKLVVPKLFAGRGAEDTVRIWVPGCATGEEVFSIAILVREYMDRLVAVPRVQIFATDIDDPSLVVARASRYPEALLGNVSPERRRRFFVLDGDSYVVKKDVRELCVFSPHSVVRDPPFSRLDLISCRNVMIYFGPDVQSQVIPTFHYALRPGGYLFLGTSENVTQFADLFTPADKKNRIFRAREDVVPIARVPLAIGGLRPAPFATSDRRGDKSLAGAALRQAVEGQVLERFAPAHVVVNRDGDIVHYSPRTGKYLEPMAGVPSRQILTLARRGLRLDLRTVLRELVETEQKVVREGLAVETDDGRVQMITLIAEPLGERDAQQPLFLLVFSDVGPLLKAGEIPQAVLPDATALHLERELRDTRERLQSLIEEYETALEELKSSNEELVSVNEELQSTNEELEASKEEMHSLNEEMHTVNAELSGKVDALDQANGDLQNLFESTRVATVFLDRDMVIRSFTPAVSQIFNILPTDRGRPLTDLASRISLPTLGEDVRTVFATGEMLERTIDQDRGSAYFLVRLAPYRGNGGTTDGVVVTFVDVTTLTQAEAHQRVLIAELNHRVKNMLMVVVGIAEQSYRATPDPAQFKATFIERLMAMSRSYALLSRDNWTVSSIGELARVVFAPFGLERVYLDGPDIRLRPKRALSLGMVLHELAANAVKHGALAGETGRIVLRWHRDGSDIQMMWRESGGAGLAGPPRQGFGLRLVSRETSYGLGGRADLDFSTAGLVATLRFPVPAGDSDGP